MTTPSPPQVLLRCTDGKFWTDPSSLPHLPDDHILRRFLGQIGGMRPPPVDEEGALTFMLDYGIPRINGMALFQFLRTGRLSSCSPTGYLLETAEIFGGVRTLDEASAPAPPPPPPPRCLPQRPREDTEDAYVWTIVRYGDVPRLNPLWSACEQCAPGGSWYARYSRSDQMPAPRALLPESFEEN